MKLFDIVLLLGYLTVTVSASGYRASAEHVWWWYAYQVDLANPEADRTIGYRCPNWIDKDKRCASGYAPCRGSRTQPPNSCYFAEFIGWITSGNADKYAKREITYPKTDKTNPDAKKNLIPDVVGTADLLHKSGVFRAIKPYNVIRNGLLGNIAYNDKIARVGHVLGDARNRMSPTEFAANQDFFTKGMDALQLVVDARDVDHSRHIKEELQKAFPAITTEITVKCGPLPRQVPTVRPNSSCPA